MRCFTVDSGVYVLFWFVLIIVYMLVLRLGCAEERLEQKSENKFCGLEKHFYLCSPKRKGGSKEERFRYRRRDASGEKKREDQPVFVS